MGTLETGSSADQREFVDAVEAWVEKELRPVARTRWSSR
jgi:hypothetical protein